MVYSLNFQWKRKTVTVTAGTALTAGHQVKLVIPKETEMQTDFRDLRFETTDGYGLPHWLETVNTIPTPDEATVWVKLKAVVNASGTVDIYMYYGNPYVASASNGTNTFIDFTDFNDLSGFTQQLGTWSVSNGYLITTQTVEQANYLRRDTPLPAPPYIASFRVRHLVNGGGRGIIFEGNNPLTTSSIMWAIATHTDLLYLNINSDWAVQSGVATDINVWYIGNVQVKASNNIATIYTDGRTSLLGTKTNTANSSGTGHYWGFCMYASDPGEHFDWVFVRKYVDTEPATPTIGSTATTVNWNPRRKKITINTTTATPASYQVKITVPFVPEMNIDFSDLRFVSKTGTALDYWIESSTSGITADVWVELTDAIGASSSDYIYVHYGNPNLTSASNGDNTFVLFDNFNASTIDTNKWTQGSNIWTIANGMVSADLQENGVNNYLRCVTAITNINSTETILRGKYSWNTGGGAYRLGFTSGCDTTPVYTENDNNYVYVDVNGTGSIYWDSVTQGTQSITGATPNTWYKFKSKRLSGGTSTFGIYTDGTDTLIGEKAATSLVGTGSYLALGCFYNTMSVDLIFVRKIVATEPAIDLTAVAEAMNVFSRRKKLTINNNSGGTLTDYQVPIAITYAPAMQADFDDIRFVDASGNLLPYWIEDKTDSDHAHVWIKVNLPNYGASPVGDNIVYMYYGNSNLASASDITNIFLLYEDFESYTVGATINGVNGWVVLDGYGGGSLTTVQTDYAVSPGIKSLRIGATSSGNQRNDAVKTLSSKITDDIIVELDFRTTKPAVHSGGGDTIQWSYAGCCHIIDDAKLAAGISLGRGYAAQGDDFIWHQPDGTVMTTFAINTWYKLRMDVLFSTKKSSHYINGTRYTTDVNFSDVTATGITKFSSWRYSWGNAYYTWVDNIRIRKYAAVDPIVTTGQEEHTRKGGILIY